MSPETARAAAQVLEQAWRSGAVIDALPVPLRPTSRAEGYAVQEQLAARCSGGRAGWKIAATSTAGQQHIGVDGPLAGRLLPERMLSPGALVDLTSNRMRVAEAEFAFRLGRDLPALGRDRSVAEVMEAVSALHLAIEIPDSRYADFATVGAAPLIADFACASWLVVGPEVTADWRSLDLVPHEVVVRIDGAEAARGRGANVLGDPRGAMAWIANELNRYGSLLRAGELVTTGTCVVPVPVRPGVSLVCDYGVLGTLDVRLG